VKANGSTPRFYNRVGIEEMNGGYAITLGDHLVQTPRGKTVILPTRDLAQAIAVCVNSFMSIMSRVASHV
jgi:chaperone required for assembly of F1-ATPase